MVSAFADAMYSQAAPMIGEEPVIIDGVTLSCVLAESGSSVEFSEGGFDPSNSLTAVCKTSALPAASILKKTATARGGKFRVTAVSTGASFATITLETVTKA